MEQPQKSKKKFVTWALVLIIVALIPLALIAWLYHWSETGSSFFYAVQINYQFQDLNKDVGGIVNGKTDSRRLFLINEEVYVFDHADNSEVNVCYTIHKADGNILIATINDSSSGGFLINDYFLYYSVGYMPYNTFKRIDVLSGQTENITKQEYETEYFKLEPLFVSISENGKYKKRYELSSKNTIDRLVGPELYPWGYYNYADWFSYDSTYYFVVSEYTDNMLCEYDLETQTYIKIARLGNISKSHLRNHLGGFFMHDCYIYYYHGMERSRLTGIPLGDPQTTSQKKACFARISLITLEHESVKEDDYMELYNSYS